MKCKFKCVGYNKKERSFTIGKIYEFNDGHMVGDDGFDYDHWHGDITPDYVIKWFSPWYKFELVIDASELHITVKGNETIAVYKHDGKTEKAVAKCSPEDKFDFKVGAKIALERLGVLPTEPTVTEKPMRLEFYATHGELGVCGTPTKYTDAYGTPLFVGDIVEHFGDNKSFGETVITDNGKQFVMGIKCACNDETGEIKGWTIIKKKSFSDMKRGDTVFHGKVQYV